MSDSSVYPPESRTVLTSSTVLICVKGDAHPGFVPRVLEQFAKRSLLPEKIACRVRRAKNGARLTIRIWIEDVESHTMGHIGRCLAQIPGTVSVEVGGVPV